MQTAETKQALGCARKFLDAVAVVIALRKAIVVFECEWGCIVQVLTNLCVGKDPQLVMRASGILPMQEVLGVLLVDTTHSKVSAQRLRALHGVYWQALLHIHFAPDTEDAKLAVIHGSGKYTLWPSSYQARHRLVSHADILADLCWLSDSYFGMTFACMIWLSGVCSKLYCKLCTVFGYGANLSSSSKTHSLVGTVLLRIMGPWMNTERKIIMPAIRKFTDVSCDISTPPG